MNFLTEQVFKAITLKAKYLAQDFWGDVLWFENKPNYNAGHWEAVSGDWGKIGKVRIPEFEDTSKAACIKVLLNDNLSSFWIGKVCWFYGKSTNAKDYVYHPGHLGVLTCVDVDNEYPFITDGGCRYTECLPAKLEDIEKILFTKEE